MWQVSGDAIADPDMPPPPGGYPPLRVPKLYDRFPEGTARL